MPASVEIPGGTVYSVGKLDGNQSEVLGWIEDVAIGPDGYALILDSQNHDITAVSPAGVIEAVVGRGGSGPHELRFPSAIAWTGNEFIVLDRGNARVQEVSTDDNQVSTRFNVGLDLRDLCQMGTSLYALGLHEGNVLVELNEGGAVSRYFAEADTSRGPHVARNWASGSLACDAATGTVVVAARIFPLLRAFSEEGGLAWTARVPEFRQTIISLEEDGGTTYSAPDGGGVSLIDGIGWHDARLWVQVGLQTPEEPRPSRLATYLYSPTTGAWSELGQLPRIVEMHDGFTYFAPSDPFPRLVKTRWVPPAE